MLGMRVLTLVAIVAITIISSCSDDSSCSREVSQDLLDAVDKAQLAIDNKLIDDYIAANSITGVQEINGIKCAILKEGDGLIPCLENTVVVTYKGSFMSNGNVFDSRQLSPIEFPLNRLIMGWRLTFASFSKGTKATIYVPSGFGYGPDGYPQGNVPGNANLIFEITLLGVR